MSTDYDLSKIRALLIEGFSETELRDFCFDTPEFRPVHHELAELTGKAATVRHLLEFAVRRALLSQLLAWAKEQNPLQYAQHQPYELPASTSLPSSPLPLSHSRPLRVFLCHASADKPVVRDLYQRLSQEGFIQPWLDEEELLPGQDWDTEIRKAVRASDVVLVCLSPQSITKAGYVQKEIRFALDIADEQPEGTIFLIPLRLEACDVPERLSRWQWANLFETRGYDRLLRAMRLRADAIGGTIAAPPAIPRVIPSVTEESPLTAAIPESSRSPVAPPPVKPEATSPPPAEKLPVKRELLPSVQPVTPTSPDRVTLTKPIHLELLCIPAGEFLMGSDPTKDKDAQQDEQPQHRVYVSEFYVGKYPVTNEQYAIFVKATRHQAPDHWEKGKIPTGKEDHPVVGILRADAAAFCKWLSQTSGQSFRLSTEAEWEKAARGTDGRIYPWGNQWDKSKLNSLKGGSYDTTPVSQYSPGGDSPYGVADMCGNVWEWCADWYDEKEYYRRAQALVKDPRRPEISFGSGPVLRGGTRCATRYWFYEQGSWGPDIFSGFRVATSGPFPSELLNH